MTACDLQLPRAAWPDHPNYPRHLLLVRSHEGFRRASRRLVERAEAGHDAEAIGWGFRTLKWAMHGHERYEEHKLYPYLEARWPLSCDALRAGHERLAEADQVVSHAVTDADGPATAALVEALEAHDAILNAHLDEEEALVVPALLALTPAEFDAYYNRDIHSLLADLEG
jgi:hypothetical protein